MNKKEYRDLFKINKDIYKDNNIHENKIPNKKETKRILEGKKKIPLSQKILSIFVLAIYLIYLIKQI